MFRSDAGMADGRLEASYRTLRMVGKLTLSKNTERSGVQQARLVNWLQRPHP